MKVREKERMKERKKRRKKRSKQRRNKGRNQNMESNKKNNQRIISKLQKRNTSSGQQYYIDIRYSIELRRKAIFFTVMLTIPSMVISKFFTLLTNI